MSNYRSKKSGGAGPWISWTPTFYNFTANSIVFRYRRNGQNYEVEGVFQVVVPDAAPAAMSLPNASVISNSDIPSFGAAAILQYSKYTASNGGGAAALYSTSGVLHADVTDYSKVYFAALNAADASANIIAPMRNANNCFNGGANVYVSYTVPIVGL